MKNLFFPFTVRIFLCLTLSYGQFVSAGDHTDEKANTRQIVVSGIAGSENSVVSEKVLREAYGRIGLELVVKPLPAERSLLMSNAGLVDGELFRIKNIHKKYQNLLMVPVSVNFLEGVVFTSGLEFPVSGWDSLKPYSTGIQIGVKFAEKGTQGLNPLAVDTNELLFGLLNSGRVDLVVAARLNGIKTISSLSLEGIKALEPPVIIHPLFHYLHKKHADIVPELETALQAMKNENRINEIREHHIRQMKGI